MAGKFSYQLSVISYQSSVISFFSHLPAPRSGAPISGAPLLRRSHLPGW
ncbi:MAG: hypothetical protein ACKPHT_14560 [Microcystis panniformis]